jgi:catechol 2,3-dioxygenase-like lactoylglutathione lyase family enzyme
MTPIVPKPIATRRILALAASLAVALPLTACRSQPVNSITCNLIVPSIEDSLPFYVDRLGFERTVEVPHEGKLGFVILKRGALELMLQSRASVAGDVPAIAGDTYRSALYIEVDKLAPIRTALKGWPLVTPERTTQYGAREIIVRDPAGNVVAFASRET